jgi:hypothetical protein
VIHRTRKIIDRVAEENEDTIGGLIRTYLGFDALCDEDAAVNRE